MSKIIVYVLGLAIVIASAWFYVAGTSKATKASREQAEQKLENVQQAAQKFEQDSQKRADDIADMAKKVE